MVTAILETARPFLWGPVKTALIQDAKEHGPNTILKLCYEDHQRVKEMMVAVLTELGRDNLSLTEDVLHKLFPVVRERSAWKQAWSLVVKQKPDQDGSNRSARRIAIEVAGNLGITQLLMNASVHRDQKTRAAAVLHTYYLWQRDRVGALEVLEYLATNVMHGVVPDVAAFEAFASLSLAIFFDHADDSAVLSQLQVLWRVVMNKVFSINLQTNRVGKAVRGIVRERIFAFATSYLFGVLKDLPEYNPINQEDLAAFFTRNDADKTLFRNLVRYIDIDDNYSTEQMMPDLKVALGKRDLFIEMAFSLVVNARMVRYYDESLPMITYLLDEARTDPVPSPYIGSLTQSLQTVLERNPHQDELFQLFVHWMKICQEYYAEHYTFPGLHRVQKGLRLTFFAHYIIDEFRRTGSARSEWLEHRIRQAIIARDTDFCEYLIKIELAQVGLDARLVHPALEVLALLTEWDGRPSSIDEEMSHLLSRLSAVFPDEVEEFLAEHKRSDGTRLLVVTSDPADTIGTLIGMGGWDFIVNHAILGSPALRHHLIAILMSAADFHTIEAWMKHMLREILNIVYGEVVFPQSHIASILPVEESQS